MTYHRPKAERHVEPLHGGGRALHLYGVRQRHWLYALIGLRWPPGHLPTSIPADAWPALDVLATAIFDEVRGTSGVTSQLIADTSAAVGFLWPLPATLPVTLAKSRDAQKALAVPILWGVMAIRGWLEREPIHRKDDDAVVLARSLERTLADNIGRPYGDPYYRTINAAVAWRQFEAALSHAGPFFLLPSFHLPASGAA